MNIIDPFNGKEAPSPVFSLKQIQDKLQAISLEANQNANTPAYKEFLEFILDFNQCDDKNGYFWSLTFCDMINKTSEDQNKSQRIPPDPKKISNMLDHVLKEDLLDLEDLLHLWKAMRQNYSVELAVFKRLSQRPNSRLKVSLLENIISHLLKVPSSEIKPVDCNLIFSLYNMSERSDQLSHTYLDFHWQILLNGSIPSWLPQKLYINVCALIEEKRLTNKNKNLILDRCIENTSSNSKELSVISLEILRELIKSYPTETFIKNGSQRDYVHFLCKEKGLLNKLAKELKYFRQPEHLMTHRDQVTKNTELLVLLTTCIPNYGDFVTYDIVTNLWEIALATGGYPRILTIIKDIPKNGENLHLEDLERFFHDNMTSDKFQDIVKLGTEGFLCFRSMFVIVNHLHKKISEVALVSKNTKDFPSIFDRLENKYKSYSEEDTCFLFQVDTFPSKLEGYQTLWEIVRRSQASKAKLGLFVSIHTKLNPKLDIYIKDVKEDCLNLCFQSLMEELQPYQESSKILQCLGVIQALIDKSDRENFEHSKLHSQLVKGSHDSKNNSVYFVNQEILPNEPEAYLIRYDNTLNLRAREIFTKWFESFSDNGKMDPQQLAAFTNSCTSIGNEHIPTQRMIINIFEKYDDDKDCYLTLDNFLKSYLDSCKENPKVVWNNLNAKGRARDLKPLTKKIEQDKLRASIQTSSLISSNNEYIKLLLSLLENTNIKIAIEALSLLHRLPTSPATFADVVSLRGVRDISGSEKPDWSYVLDQNHISKLFYCLDIVEYLIDLNDKDEENENMKSLWCQDPRLLEYNKTWLSDFLACGGCEHLKEVLLKVKIPDLRTRIQNVIKTIEKKGDKNKNLNSEKRL